MGALNDGKPAFWTEKTHMHGFLLESHGTNLERVFQIDAAKGTGQTGADPNPDPKGSVWPVQKAPFPSITRLEITRNNLVVESYA